MVLWPMSHQNSWLKNTKTSRSSRAKSSITRLRTRLSKSMVKSLLWNPKVGSRMQRFATSSYSISLSRKFDTKKLLKPASWSQTSKFSQVAIILRLVRKASTSPGARRQGLVLQEPFMLTETFFSWMTLSLLSMPQSGRTFSNRSSTEFAKIRQEFS